MPTTTKRSMRSILTIAVVAAVLGLLLGSTVLGPGAAGAQETTTTTSDDSPWTDAGQAARIRAALDDLVAEGTISEDQAVAVAAHLASQWNFHGRRLHRLHAGLDVAAATIGITEADLVEALRDGQTVAEVAEANGIEAQTVVDALVAEINTRVDEAVANGNLDAERATEIKDGAVERITDFINRELRFRRGPASLAPAA